MLERLELNCNFRAAADLRAAGEAEKPLISSGCVDSTAYFSTLIINDAPVKLVLIKPNICRRSAGCLAVDSWNSCMLLHQT